MGKVQVEIKRPFGKIIIEGSTASDLFDTIRSLPENFVNELETLISRSVLLNKERDFNEIVKFTDNGPTLIIKNNRLITHYEAVGLILYFSENKRNKPSHISKLLAFSGINAQVSSRLNEMAKKGLVFKPNLKGSEWSLSPRGEQWIEGEVLQKLKRST